MAGTIDIFSIWLRAMTAVSLQAGILILAVLAAGQIFKLSPRIRCQLWCLVLLRLALPFGIETPFGLLIGKSTSPEVSTISAPTADVLVPASASQQLGTATADASGLSYADSGQRGSWPRRLFGLWLFGVITLGAFAMVRQRRLRRRLARYQRATPELASRVQELWRGMSGRGSIGVQITRRSGPALTGVLSPTVVLPAAVAAWPKDHLEPVLMHELVHARRRDGYWNLLLTVVEICYFFHPLVWLAASRMRAEREFACDDEVIARGPSKLRRYVGALLQLADDPKLAPEGTLPLVRRSRLSDRVRRLLRSNPEPRASGARVSAATLAIGAVLCFAAGRTADSAATPSPTSMTTSQVLSSEDPRWLRLQELAVDCHPDLRAERAALLTELTASLPDLEAQQAAYLFAFSPAEEPELYGVLREIWRNHVATHSEHARVIENAAVFFSLHEPAVAIALYARLDDLDPGRWDLALSRGDLYLQLSDGQAAENRESALAMYHEAGERASNDAAAHLSTLARAARSLAAAGALEQGAGFAERALAVVARTPDPSAVSTSIHRAHVVLGHRALDRGNEPAAVHRLLQAADVGGSAVLGSFGPDLELANTLLRLGYRQEVVAYLERCRHFWIRGRDRLDTWVQAIRNGETPSLGRRA